MASAVESGQTSDDRPSHGARRAKSAGAFRTISEVADDLDVAQHVLRFWESKFPQVRPLKRGGGRRYYRPEDVDLLRRIRSLLYEEGYTIKGAQKLLKGQRRAPANPPPAAARENGNGHTARQDEQPSAAPPPVPFAPLDPRQKEALIAIKAELARLRDRLRRFIP